MGYKKEELYNLLVNKKYPKDVTFRELEKLLLAVGFIKKQGKGSHCIFKIKNNILTLSNHGKGKEVRRTYVKQAGLIITNQKLEIVKYEEESKC